MRFGFRPPNSRWPGALGWCWPPEVSQELNDLRGKTFTALPPGFTKENPLANDTNPSFSSKGPDASRSTLKLLP
jgi:hypothetical protein